MHLSKIQSASALSLLMGVLLIASVGLTSCSNTKGNVKAVTPQGTIELQNLKVGVPETVLEEAIITFELDENPISRTGGKHQYLSRTRDSKNGKYLAQCKDGKCFELQAYYLETPITKEQALETVKTMLPTGAPDQSRVDDTEVKEGEVDNPKIRYYFGDRYMGELVYANKTSDKIAYVNVYDMQLFDAYNKGASSNESAEESKEASGNS